jgi:chemotaxis protein MotA
MRKDYGTFWGLILGIGSIFGAFIIEGGSLKILFLLPALIIVFGGTFSAVIIGFGFDKFKNIFKLIKMAYLPAEYNMVRLINNFVEASMISRREGLLSIEKTIGKIEYLFPKKLFGYLVDGTDMNSLESLAILEIKTIEERHNSNIQIFTKMGGYAPTMGIIGTVMGLIMTLASAGANPDVLIHNIASAFIATLWGIVSANILWFPIGDKLKKCHLQEKNMMEVSLEGVLAIRNGEIPSIVRARLLSMLPQKDQKSILYT